jgi:glycosyltransferase involved in cell wall biosynthesis
MRIGVVHDSLRTVGGAERVCLKTIEALKERGHEVVLGTVEKPDWGVVDRIMGRAQRPDSEHSFVNLGETPLHIYIGLAVPLIASVVRKECDIIVQTNGDVMPIGDITYMHYLPASLSDDGSYREGSRPLRALYSRPYVHIYRHLIEQIPEKNIFANSIFTKVVVSQTLGRVPTVLYPPINIRQFEGDNSRQREKAVLICGRFSPDKNFEFAMDVAKLLPSTPFLLAGTVTGGAASRRYYQKLVSIVEERELKNITFIVNRSFDKIIELYTSCAVLLNCKVNEPFGMAVVEGMAGGAVPVVHRSGGAWIDSLERADGKYGYSYIGVTGAANAIRRLIDKKEETEVIRSRAKLRAKLFSEEIFKQKFAASIEAAAKEGS